MYKIIDAHNIKRLADKATIPVAADNTDYQAYLAWVVEGNSPEPADVFVPSVPNTVSMRQARLALLQFGLLTLVEGAMTQGTDADKIEWEYAIEVNRNTFLVQNMQAVLGITDTDLDNLFTLASTL